MDDFGQTVGAAAAAILILVTGAIMAIGSWLVRTVLTDTKRLSILEERQVMQHEELMSALQATNAQVAALAKTNCTAIETQAQIARVLEEVTSKESRNGK